MKVREFNLGAEFTGTNRAAFGIWAPDHKKVELVLSGRTLQMSKGTDGYFDIETSVPSDCRYAFLPAGVSFKPDGLSDPMSRFQPDGVHKASKIIDPNSFEWTDQNWKGIPLEDLIIYELHTEIDNYTAKKFYSRMG